MPGNHDVSRRRNFHFDRPGLAKDANAFHADANGLELRELLLTRFEAFRRADDTQGSEAIFSEAGAYAHLVPWQGHQVGIVGINTAWLCKDNQDREQLTPGKGLLEKALDSVRAADLCIVLGHHPIDWLVPDQQKAIRALLAKAGALYLHGHLHQQWAEPTHGAGGQFLAIQTGASFQAEEHEVWKNGLLWGAADLAAQQVRLQPYEWARNHQEFVVASAAFPPALQEWPGSWWLYNLPGARPAPSPAPMTPPAGAMPPARPAPNPLPSDSWADIRQRFVGREDLLDEVAEAVRSIQPRAAEAGPATQKSRVKLVWVHGFGGMGKSWFLHCARRHAEDTKAVRTLIIQWDSQEWRAPLRSEPTTAEELFDALAYRLDQVMGPAATTTYRQVTDQVKQAAPERARLLSRFENQLRAAYNDNNGKLREETRRLLRREQLRNQDLTKRQEDIDRWRDRPMRYESGFASWCREGSHSTDKAVIDPDSLRADALRQALQQAAARQPLLLLLDASEVLNEETDTWLRWLLVPLLRDDTPLLALIGSRKKPDIDQPAGSNEGWLAELEQRIRPINFTEALLFTVDDIGKMLTNWPSLPIREDASLAKYLYRLTLGVPLAVYTLLNLYESGDKLTTLAEPSEQELTTPDDGSAIRQVIEKTVGHLLRYLPLSPRSNDSHKHLHDIITLGLLQWADPKVLQVFWRSKAAEVWTRLRDLDRRYGLLSGNDLHATVRNYLRQHWRYEARRPDAFDSVLAGLREAIKALPSEFVRGSADAVGCTLRHLNLLAWQQPAAALPPLTQLLAVALAYDVKPDAIEALLRELAPLGKNHYRLWQAPDAPTRPEVIYWLRHLPVTNWLSFERSCLALISGLALIGNWQQMQVGEALTALQLLSEAVAAFSLEDVPQATAVGQAYFQVARSLQNAKDGSTNWPGEIEMAYHYAIKLRTELAISHNNLGNLLDGQFGRAEEAKRHYDAAIDVDPKFCFAHNNLGHLLAGQGQLTEARKHYGIALDLDRQNSTGHRGLAWLALLTADLPAAYTHAAEARLLSAGQAGMLFLEVGLAVWTEGWEASRGMLTQWLQYAPSWLLLSQDYRLVALFRKIQAQGNLEELSFVLQAIADERPWCRPWHEAVAALAARQGVAACTTEHARTLYGRLSQ